MTNDRTPRHMSASHLAENAGDLDRDIALAWLRRWDAQQATFFPDREERFEILLDVLGHVLDRPDTLIVDLGVGPGSLSARILDRFDDATVVGVDMDPLLLDLAESAYGSDRFRVVPADLRQQGWLARLDLERAPDAFVSTTALHWLEGHVLAGVLTAAASRLAPGGLVVNADHILQGADQPRLDALLGEVAARAVGRSGGSDAEGWRQWWDAALGADELARSAQARGQVELDHQVSDPLTVDGHLDALRAGGCVEAGVVWQQGDDRVVVGLR